MHPTRELPHGVRISVHYPRIEPDRLVEPDTPEEGALICYVSIFEDDGLYRMYMMNWGDVNEGWDDGSRGNLYDYMLAYAESSDGTNWTKPSVGAVSWNGSTDNNLVYTGHAAPAFKDPNAPPDQRYKLVCMDTYNGRPCLRGAVSADGLRFKTLETPILFDYGSDTHTVIRFIRPGPRHDRWIYPHTFPCYGLLTTPSPIPDMPDELSIYIIDGGYWAARARATRIRRYALRMDGFVSVNASLQGGEVVTKPLVFSGGELVMNVSTSAAGSVRVGIQDAEGQPLEGFTLADCPEIYGDELERVVSFGDRTDLSQPAGLPVRLRFVIRDADLYAFRFRAG